MVCLTSVHPRGFDVQRHALLRGRLDGDDVRGLNMGRARIIGLGRSNLRVRLGGDGVRCLHMDRIGRFDLHVHGHVCGRVAGDGVRTRTMGLARIVGIGLYGPHCWHGPCCLW